MCARRLIRVGEISMFDLILGVGLLALGMLTLAARLFGWQWAFRKREEFRKRWGKVTGEIVHAVSYTLLPLAVGALFLFNGLANQAG